MKSFNSGRSLSGSSPATCPTGRRASSPPTNTAAPATAGATIARRQSSALPPSSPRPKYSSTSATRARRAVGGDPLIDCHHRSVPRRHVPAPCPLSDPAPGRVRVTRQRQRVARSGRTTTAGSSPRVLGPSETLGHSRSGAPGRAASHTQGWNPVAVITVAQQGRRRGGGAVRCGRLVPVLADASLRMPAARRSPPTGDALLPPSRTSTCGSGRRLSRATASRWSGGQGSDA